MLYAFHRDVYVLLDTGSNLSSITPLITVNIGVGPENLPKPFSVSTPMGELVVTRRIYMEFSITILHKITLANLIELDMMDFNVILCMIWILSCYASIDCRTCVVKF